MSDKLPEWPEELEQPCGLGDVISYYTWAYDAALARMEALVEYVDHKWECELRMSNNQARGGCTCGLSELLAACERSVAAQPSEAGRRKS